MLVIFLAAGFSRYANTKVGIRIDNAKIYTLDNSNVVRGDFPREIFEVNLMKLEARLRYVSNNIAAEGSTCISQNLAQKG